MASSPEKIVLVWSHPWFDRVYWLTFQGDLGINDESASATLLAAAQVLFSTRVSNVQALNGSSNDHAPGPLASDLSSLPETGPVSSHLEAASVGHAAPTAPPKADETQPVAPPRRKKQHSQQASLTSQEHAAVMAQASHARTASFDSAASRTAPASAGTSPSKTDQHLAREGDGEHVVSSPLSGRKEAADAEDDGDYAPVPRVTVKSVPRAPVEERSKMGTVFRKGTE